MISSLGRLFSLPYQAQPPKKMLSSIRHCCHRFFSIESVIKSENAIKSSFETHRQLERLAKIRSIAEIESYETQRESERLAKIRSISEKETIIQQQNESLVSDLIRAYGRSGMLENALQLFDEMEALGTPKSAQSFNSLLRAFAYSAEFSRVPIIFDTMVRKYPKMMPNECSYHLVITSLCKSMLPESAFCVLNEMDERGFVITLFTYTAIIDAFYKKKKIEEAENLWDRMVVVQGCNPDLFAYNVRLKHVKLGKPEDVERVFDEMCERGLIPDIICYNHLIECYLENGLVEEAYKVYKSLEGNGCVADGVTFKTMICLLCRMGHLDNVLEMFRDSLKMNRYPSSETLKVLVEGLVKNSRVEEAKEVVATVKYRFPLKTLEEWEKIEQENELFVFQT